MATCGRYGHCSEQPQPSCPPRGGNPGPGISDLHRTDPGNEVISSFRCRSSEIRNKKSGFPFSCSNIYNEFEMDSLGEGHGDLQLAVSGGLWMIRWFRGKVTLQLGAE